MLIHALQWLVLATSGACPGTEPLTIPASGSQTLAPEQRAMVLPGEQNLDPERFLRETACAALQPPSASPVDHGQQSWIVLNTQSLSRSASRSTGWGLYFPATGYRELCVHWPLAAGQRWDNRCLGHAMDEDDDRIYQATRSFLAPEGLDPARPVLISAQSPFFTAFPIRVGSGDALLAERSRANLFIGAAYGILLALVVYGLLLLASTRNLSLLFFSAYFALFATALFLAEGLHVTWLGMGSLITGMHLSYALLGLAFLAGTLFLGHFLRSRESDYWLHAVLWTTGLLAPVLMFLAAVRLEWASWASETGALVFAVGGLIAAGRGLFHGRRNTGPLLTGFVVLMMALVVNSLVRLGWLPSPGMSSIDVLKSALLLGGVSLGLAAEREFSNLRRQRDRASLLAETHQRIALYRVDFDAVTGLPNRQRFFKLVSERVANAAEGQGLGAIRIELSDYRKLRHIHGQEVAEDLLRSVAGCLHAFETSGRVLARTETDEFSLLLPLPGRQSSAESLLDKIAGQIRDELARPFPLGGEKLRIRLAMGASFYPGRANSGEQLLVQAESGVFESREAGDDRLHLYGRGDAPALMERWAMGRQLTAALEKHEIRVHYQPIVALADGRTRQLEALARWTDPELGEVPPTVFIPVAESLGLIDELGRQVVSQACRDAAAWQEEGVLGTIRLSLNLSPLQLRDQGFERWFLDTIAEHGLGGHQINLEVTENTLVENLSSARTRLQRLVDHGVGISVDDFGVGYSSLSYIRELPINTLKIDRSFMTRLDHSEAEREIVRSLLQMARKLGLTVVAEGIERQSQAAFLRQHRCKLGQGFLFGHPISAADIIGRLRRENPVPRPRSKQP